MDETSFTLRPLPPFSLALTVWALRRRPGNRIDRWDGNTYSRVMVLGGRAVRVSVSQKGSIEKPALRVRLGGRSTGGLRPHVSSVLEKMFSLERDLASFYSLSGKDKLIGPLASRFMGLKPPRFPTVFESLVNAFSCQQVSLELGIILLNRLSEAYGIDFMEKGMVFRAFPGPEDLAELTPEDFRELGFSRNKGKAIIELSGRALKGELQAESLEGISDAGLIKYLLKIRGVGRWTAEYVLLRGFGRINIFPGDDVGAQRNLQNLLGLDERPDYEEMREITSRWQPYAGFVYFYFLLESLKRRGHLS